jgi:predicted ATP-binding protein involved in virulence
MIRLDKLTFEGFRTPLHSASVEFSKDLVTVIYGDNGSGKTTYLRAINAFLSQDSAYLESISVQCIVCNYLYDETNEIVNDDGDVVHEEVLQENLPGIVTIHRS